MLGGRSEQAMVAFISRVALLGLLLAVAILVLVLSVMNGFEREFRERILGVAPHAILWFDQPVPRPAWQVYQSQLAAQKPILRSMPHVQIQAVLRVGTKVLPAQLQGVDTVGLQDVLAPYLLAGATSMAGLSDDQIILGAGLARRLGVARGDRLAVFALDMRGSSGLAATRLLAAATQRAYKVRAVLATGTQLDEALALVNVAQVSELAGLGQSVHGIALQVDDIYGARAIAQRAAREVGVPARITDWTRVYGNLYTAIQLSRQLVILLVASIIGVALFNVVVTLGMVVRHKRSDIAILRTMGLRRTGVLAVFFYQGLLIALIGCTMGLLLGAVLAWVAPELVQWLQAVFGLRLLDTQVYPIDYLPAQLRIGDLFMVGIAAMAMSMVAVSVPAWRASQLLPAKALRDN